MGLPWQERDALKEQYPEPYVNLLLEVLGLVDEVEMRHLTAYEATMRLKGRFREVMAEYVPACEAKVAAYRAKVAAEQAQLHKAAAETEEKRQAAIAGEKLRIQKEAEDRNAAIYADAREAELRRQAVWQKTRDDMEKLRREKNETENLTAEEAAKEGARLLTAIETKGK